MLFELLKNAMRAVVERHPSDTELPPIQLFVIQGGEDLVIKVGSDPAGRLGVDGERSLKSLGLD